MKNVLAFAGAAIGAALIFGAPAFALDVLTPATPAASTVVVPWGNWLGQLLLASSTVVISLIGWTIHKFAPPAFSAFLTNDVIAKAVDYAIATTSQAAHGKEASISVTNDLIAAAANWVVANEPTIANWAGANLRPLIVAQLAAAGVVPAEASAATLRLQTPAVGSAS